LALKFILRCNTPMLYSLNSIGRAKLIIYFTRLSFKSLYFNTVEPIGTSNAV
jgi:hypothetical protein